MKEVFQLRENNHYNLCQASQLMDTNNNSVFNEIGPVSHIELRKYTFSVRSLNSALAEYARITYLVLTSYSFLATKQFRFVSYTLKYNILALILSFNLVQVSDPNYRFIYEHLTLIIQIHLDCTRFFLVKRNNFSHSTARQTKSYSSAQQNLPPHINSHYALIHESRALICVKVVVRNLNYSLAFSS